MSKNNDIDLIFNFNYTINLFLYNLKTNIIEFIQNNNCLVDSINVIRENKIQIFRLVSLYFLLSLKISILANLNLYLFYIIYWVFLGVLSTIGFGFGLQTGVFFVIPYILNQCETNTNLYVFINTLPIVIFWGFGSALGEIPPFILAKYNSDKNEIFNSIKNSSFIKILDIIKKHRFKTILFMSAWPNVTFDMCGMMCGYYGLSLYDFLLPTIIGKALIKSPCQSLFVIYSYSYYINNNILETESIDNYNLQNILLILWNICFFFILIYFIKMTIENIAKLKN
jgi:uncharacterized membrane protein YdjX (TVP38/TMEM64 family)